ASRVSDRFRQSHRWWTRFKLREFYLLLEVSAKCGPCAACGGYLEPICSPASTAQEVLPASFNARVPAEANPKASKKSRERKIRTNNLSRALATSFSYSLRKPNAPRTTTQTSPPNGHEKIF